jgi:hypothetical protein
MLSAIWNFLSDEINRTILGWLGGGLVVLAGGAFAVVKYFFPKKEEKSIAPTFKIALDDGGMAEKVKEAQRPLADEIAKLRDKVTEIAAEKGIPQRRCRRCWKSSARKAWPSTKYPRDYTLPPIS